MDETNSAWLSAQGLADEIGVPLATLYAWRSRSRGPRAHRIGRYLRFRRPEVEAWLAGQIEERPGGPVPGSASAAATPPSAAA